MVMYLVGFNPLSLKYSDGPHVVISMTFHAVIVLKLARDFCVFLQQFFNDFILCYGSGNSRWHESSEGSTQLNLRQVVNKT